MKNPNKLFPLIVTENFEETKRFYTDTLGWAVSMETDEYVQVRSADEDGPEISFMKPDGIHPAYKGEGVIVSVPTASADDLHADLKSKEADLLGEPEDRPWGWRSFAARDPSGVLLDFFHVAGPNKLMGA
jgi:catechol 2,3-dioxygenase-like lactoylglutathione lyase family enzyme